MHGDHTKKNTDLGFNKHIFNDGLHFFEKLNINYKFKIKRIIRRKRR